MECEFDSDFAIPAFNKGDFRKWKRLFGIWQSVTDVPKSKQGGLLLFQLDNDIQDEILDFFAVEEFGDENGVDKVLHFLENKYAEDEDSYICKTYENLISYRRPLNVSLSECCREFNRLLLKAKNSGIQFPEKILAHMLLRSANIRSKDCEFILATSENILYSDVMNQLKKVFGETDYDHSVFKDVFSEVQNRYKVAYVCDDTDERVHNLRSYDIDWSGYNTVDSHYENKLFSDKCYTNESLSVTSYENKVTCENCTSVKSDNDYLATSCNKNILNGVNYETIYSGETSFIEKRMCDNEVSTNKNIMKLSEEKLSCDKEENETYTVSSNEKKINSDNILLSAIPTNSHSNTSASENNNNEVKIGIDVKNIPSSAFEFSVPEWRLERLQQIINGSNFHSSNEFFCQIEVWINFVYMHINFVSNFLIVTYYQLSSKSVCWSWKRRKKK